MKSKRPPQAKHLERSTSLALAAPVLMAAAALALATGCTEQSPCGPGTRELDGSCVAACGAGTEADPVSGECVPVCEPGTHRDEASGACLPDHARCVSGEVWDHEAGLCVDVMDLCAEGTVWVSSERRCVHEEELRVPDYVEGEDFNDYIGDASTCEELILGPMGELRSFGGRVDEPIYVFDTLRPDDDCWAFEVDEPTLMRIRMDGLGGSSAGFNLVSLDNLRHVDRLGVGTSSTSVERDAFLPQAGRYALVVTDALNFFRNGGPWHGGGDFGYYGEVELLPIPEPETIVLNEGEGFSRGSWPLQPPSDGTGVGFFRVQVPLESVFLIDVKVPNYTALPALMVIYPNGAAVSSGWDGLPKLTAFGEGGEMLIAVDFERFAAPRDVSYSLILQRMEMRMIENGSAAFSIDQASWSQGSGSPERIFGFNVKKDEVVSLDLTSSTGATCFFVWNETIDLLAGDRGCMLYGDPIFEDEIRFEVRETGLHVILVQDFAGASFFEGNLLSIPAHEYEISFRLSSQMPFPLERLGEPVHTVSSVTEDDYERYFSLVPEVGDVFRFSLEGHDAFEPFLVSYRMGPLTSSLPIDWFPSNQREFAFRSVNGWRQLFGVSDEQWSAGSFDLYAERIVPAKIGPFGATGSLGLDVDLEEGFSRHFFELTTDVPGMLSLEILPLDGVDLAIVPLKADMRSIPGLRRDEGGRGSAETLSHPLAARPTFFEVVTSDGEPLLHSLPIEIEATLVPFIMEEEPNESHEEAQELELPAGVAVEKSDEADLDWFSFTLDEASEIDIVTSPMQWGVFGRVNLSLFNSTGELLERDSGSASAGYGQILGVALPAGRYYVTGAPAGGLQPTYLLEVSHAAL